MTDFQLPARFANRANRRSLVQQVTAGLGMATPPYVSIRGGSFTLVDSNGEQEAIEGKHLDCIIIDTNIPSRVFWGVNERGQPLPYNPQADAYQPPVCFSDNGIGASENAQQPQSTNCQTCKWNVWGSAISNVTGKGVKACHVIKKVAVIPIEGKLAADNTYVPDHVEEFPFLLRVPVMSHEDLRKYCGMFAGKNFDVSEVVTRISFVHGQVGQLQFEPAGFTDAATEALVQKFLDEKKTDTLVGRGDRPWQGALPAPAAQAVAAQEQPRAFPALTQQQAAPAPSQAGQAAPSPYPPAQEPPKRTRRTKAEMEAARAPADNGGLPSFLRREQPAVQPSQAPIQPNAPAPNAEIQAALQSVFGLKT